MSWADCLFLHFFAFSYVASSFTLGRQIAIDVVDSDCPFSSFFRALAIFWIKSSFSRYHIVCNTSGRNGQERVYLGHKATIKTPWGPTDALLILEETSPCCPPQLPPLEETGTHLSINVGRELSTAPSHSSSLLTEKLSQDYYLTRAYSLFAYALWSYFVYALMLNRAFNCVPIKLSTSRSENRVVTLHFS